MELLRIDNSTAELFRWLDPWNCLEHVDIPGYFAVGAAIEEGDSIIPSGLICCFETKNRIVIEWMCIDPAHRHEGIGEKLLLKVYDVANYLSKEQVGVIIDHSDEKKAFFENAVGYFQERLFDEEESLSGTCNLKLSVIKKLPWFSRTDKIGTKPLGSVGPEVFRQFINTPETNLPGTVMCKSNLSRLYMDFLDKNLSRVVLDGEKISGIFAVAVTESSIVPIVLYSESDQETDALLISSAREAIASNDPDMALKIVSTDKNVGKLIEAIAYQKTVPMDLLLANVSEYQEALQA